MNLIHHIDTARWVCSDDDVIVVAGWCVDRDGAAVVSVRATSERGVMAESPMRPRPDVAAHLARPEALLSGFELHLGPLHDDAQVTLEAVTQDGLRSRFHSFRGADLPGRMAVFPHYTELRTRGWPFQRIQPALATEEQTETAATGRPLFSVILPTFDTVERLLRECIESVVTQRFDSWELCIADDASSTSIPSSVATEYAARDRRIRIALPAPHGGISRTTNRALEMASGSFVLLVDHDDRLLPEALGTIAAVLLDPANADCDIVYADEEKIDNAGRPKRPVLKPDFSPLFLCGVMYVGHPLCVRRTLALEVGGFDPAYDRVQDFEFLLRASHRARRIVHVPEILYAWRMVPGSIAVHGEAKGSIEMLQQRAVQDHLQRLGWAAEARPIGPHRIGLFPPAGFRRARVRVFAPEELINTPLLQTLEDIQLVRWTPDQSLEEVLGSADAGMVAFVGVPLIEASAGWLDRLVHLAMLPGSRCVSPIVRGVSGRVLEAGLTLTPDRRLVPVMHGFDPDTDGYHGALACSREVAAASRGIWVANASPYHAGEYDRVCATAWVRTSLDERSPVSGQASECEVSRLNGRDPFYNPRFDAPAGDFRLLEQSRFPGTDS